MLKKNVHHATDRGRFPLLNLPFPAATNSQANHGGRAMRPSACVCLLVLISAPTIASEASIATEGATRNAFVTSRAEARALVNLCDIDLRVELLPASGPYKALPIKDKVTVSRAVDVEVAIELEYEKVRGAQACTLAVEKYGPTGQSIVGLVSSPERPCHGPALATAFIAYRLVLPASFFTTGYSTLHARQRNTFSAAATAACICVRKVSPPQSGQFGEGVGIKPDG